jgi:hypothetical protein
MKFAWNKRFVWGLLLHQLSGSEDSCIGNSIKIDSSRQMMDIYLRNTFELGDLRSFRIINQKLTRLKGQVVFRKIKNPIAWIRKNFEG